MPLMLFEVQWKPLNMITDSVIVLLIFDASNGIWSTVDAA
jgi:hypothetical protein